MTPQMRTQQATLGGFRRMIVGGVTIGLLIVTLIGMAMELQPPQSAPVLASPSTTNIAPGIAFPTGMGKHGLPRGLTDYVRDLPVATEVVNIPPGIAFPSGMRMRGLPSDFTDYVRNVPDQPVDITTPGMQWPHEMGRVGLPHGLTDYILSDR